MSGDVVLGISKRETGKAHLGAPGTPPPGKSYRRRGALWLGIWGDSIPGKKILPLGRREEDQTPSLKTSVVILNLEKNDPRVPWLHENRDRHNSMAAQTPQRVNVNNCHTETRKAASSEALECSQTSPKVV